MKIKLLLFSVPIYKASNTRLTCKDVTFLRQQCQHKNQKNSLNICLGLLKCFLVFDASKFFQTEKCTCIYTPHAECTQKVLVMVHACQHHLSVHSNIIFKDMKVCFPFRYVVLSFCQYSSVTVEQGTFYAEINSYLLKSQLSENITGGCLCCMIGMMNFYYI